MKKITEKIASITHDARIIDMKFNFSLYKSNDIYLIVKQYDTDNKHEDESNLYEIKFTGVNNFSMHLGSDFFDINKYPVHVCSDCLYIFNIELVELTSSQAHWKIYFSVEDKQSIDIYAENIFLRNYEFHMQ